MVKTVFFPLYLKHLKGLLYTNLVVSLIRNSLLSYLDLGKSTDNCQDVVLNFVEKCKVALDSTNVYGAVLTDLSKAFDSLLYRLTISKLHAYGC